MAREKTTIMMEPFVKDFAEEYAKGYCEFELGLDPSDPSYEDEFKKAIKRALHEAFYETMIPPIKNNPTTSKVSKSLMASFYLTDPKQFAKENLTGSNSNEQQFFAGQIRGAVMSLVNAILKTKFPESFWPGQNYGYTSDKDKTVDVMKKRLVRAALASLLVGYIERFFVDSNINPDFIMRTVDGVLKQQGVIDENNNVNSSKINSKKVLQNIGKIFYESGRKVLGK